MVLILPPESCQEDDVDGSMTLSCLVFGRRDSLERGLSEHVPVTSTRFILDVIDRTSLKRKATSISILLTIEHSFNYLAFALVQTNTVLTFLNLKGH